MAAKVHIPAKRPASAPHEAVVAGVARKAAKLAELISANKAVKPNIFALLALALMCSLVRLLSVSHALPNKIGEYHNPPTIKADKAATTTAGQLISEGFIIVRFAP